MINSKKGKMGSGIFIGLLIASGFFFLPALTCKKGSGYDLDCMNKVEDVRIFPIGLFYHPKSSSFPIDTSFVLPIVLNFVLWGFIGGLLFKK